MQRLGRHGAECATKRLGCVFLLAEGEGADVSVALSLRCSVNHRVNTPSVPTLFLSPRRHPCPCIKSNFRLLHCT